MGAGPTEPALDGAEFDGHDRRRFVVAEALDIAQDDGHPLISGQFVDSLLNVTRRLSRQTLLFGTRRRVREAFRWLRRLLFRSEVGRRVEALRRPPLAAAQVVVARVHRDAE